MTSRAEITTRDAKAHVKARNGDRGRILDHVVEVTGWSRDTARRRLTAAAARPPGSGRPGGTVAHCGPSLKGEFARTLNLTCMHTGWVFTRTVRNNAHAHILSALTAAVDDIPYAVMGLDFDDGSEFLNHAVLAWAGDRGIYFTRSRQGRVGLDEYREIKHVWQNTDPRPQRWFRD
jgi:hypothetical protein